MPFSLSLNKILFLLAATALVFPVPSSATLGIQPAEPFRLLEATQENLVDRLASKLEAISVRDVLRSATLKTAPIEPFSVADKVSIIDKGFRWSDVGSDGDLWTERWEPRGISRGEDRLTAEMWEKVDRVDEEGLDEILVVSWGDNSNSSGKLPPGDGNKGVRVSFIDRPTEDEGQVRDYVNVLLVEPIEIAPDGEDEDATEISFRALQNVDAAGLVWHGNWLYVSDSTSNNGIRVFDLNHILKVSKGSGIGLSTNGDYQAFNHDYILPQARTYTLSLPSDISFKCSYIALDRNSTADGTVSILAGEAKFGTGADSRLARWKINLNTSLPLITETSESNPAERIARAEWAYTISIHGITGFSFRGRTWFIASRNDGGETNGEVLVWLPGRLSTSVNILPEQVGGIVYRKKSDQMLALSREAGMTRGIWPYSAKELYVAWAEASIANGNDIDLVGDPDGLGPRATPESPETPDDGDRASGPNKAVVVGATVGSVFAILIALVAIGLLFRWTKKQKEMKLGLNNTNHVDYTEQGLERTGTSMSAGEIPSHKHELDGREFKAELLDERQYRPELAGHGWYGAELVGHEVATEIDEKRGSRLA